MYRMKNCPIPPYRKFQRPLLVSAGLECTSKHSTFFGGIIRLIRLPIEVSVTIVAKIRTEYIKNVKLVSHDAFVACCCNYFASECSALSKPSKENYFITCGLEGLFHVRCPLQLVVSLLGLSIAVVLCAKMLAHGLRLI